MYLDKQTKNIIKVVGFILIWILALGALIVFHNQREEKFNRAMDQYETCIKEQYETTPTAYYNLFHVYPKCTQ